MDKQTNRRTDEGVPRGRDGPQKHDQKHNGPTPLKFHSWVQICSLKFKECPFVHQVAPLSSLIPNLPTCIANFAPWLKSAGVALLSSSVSFEWGFFIIQSHIIKSLTIGHRLGPKDWTPCACACGSIKNSFRNVYSSVSILIFTLSMAAWALYHFLNIGRQTLTEQEKGGESEEDVEKTRVRLGKNQGEDRVKLPLDMIMLAGIMLELLMLQFYRNLALR